MNPENMSADQWTEQQHAEAVEILQQADCYVLAAIKKDGITLLDGCPGSAGSSAHEQLCLFAMLEGFARTHRNLIERQMSELTSD